MLENLKTRILIIFISIAASVYFLIPTAKLYLSNDIQSEELKNLEQNSIGLGLDLKGGLQIILELDGHTFLKRLSKKNLSQQSKLELENILNESKTYAKNNQMNIIDAFTEIVVNKNIKLNKFYSNLSKSSNNQEVLEAINEQKFYAMKSIEGIMRKRINDHDQYGVGEPSIQSMGDDRLIVELAGITDLQKAKNYIQKTADFELSLVQENKLFLIIENIDLYFKKADIQLSEFLINNGFITREYLQEIFQIDIINYNNDIDSKNKKIISSELFDKDETSLFKTITTEEYLKNITLEDLLISDYFPFVKEEYYLFLNDFFNHSKIKEIISGNSKIVWSSNFISLGLSQTDLDQNFREIYLIASPPAISGGMIENPKAVIADLGNDNAGKWVVNLDMTAEGRKKWSRFTAKNINRKVAIVLDNEVFMAPTIRDKITAGSTQISGFNDMQEAKNIASILKAGELPAPINAVQTNFVGPSLGKDSITAGTSAMLLGVLLVFIFMIIYYKASGLIACFALLLNLFIVLAVLVTMNAVLTLPGIAGLLLTVGMTVDANVIIFERIKEELLIGSKVSHALETAYRKAFLTILDANVTTLITAFVLSFIGSGPIKGFATTLSVGIICSMFTAVFVTKTIFLIGLNNKKISI